MGKSLFFLLLALVYFQPVFSQDKEEKEQKGEKTKELEVRKAEQDSIGPNLQGEGVVFEEVSQVVEVNPLAPSKAAFYSAVLPGLGQIYNKRYWKVPLVWGAIGTGVYVYSFNNTEYRSARRAFKRRLAGFSDDEYFDLNGDGIGPDVSIEALEEAQENTQRDRDLALVITIALYALNIIDANVDAHLKQYNVDDTLALDFKPFLDINPLTNEPMYGMTLVVKF